MKSDTISAVVSVLLAIIGVATVSIILSPNASTSGVLGQLGATIKQMLCTATSPVTGANCQSLTEVVTSTFNPM